MIRLSDAFVLAYTKLRVHQIRTGVAVGVSGLLFGLIVAVIIIAQGVFSSVESFSDVGLNNRTILNVSYSSGNIGFNEYNNREDQAFILEIENAHKDLIAKKTAAAKKYNIAYEPAIEDPSPIFVDTKTKSKSIKENALGSELVQDIAKARRLAEYKPFDINGYIKNYSSASVIQSFRPIEPSAGALVYMKDDKEARDSQRANEMGLYGSDAPSLSVIEASISKPFISNTSFDPAKGEIPVIVPYNSAEKLLGLKALGAKATQQERYDRLREVRGRISEVTATYCYRNESSQSLLANAIAQQEEIKLGASGKDYVKPPVIYTVPDEKSCGAVTVASDTRTATQKKQDANQILYEKEIGIYSGDPEQQLLKVRGVGITGELGTTGQWAVSDMIQSLFTSWLGYGTWTIPADLLAQLPESSRPESIFESNEKTSKAAASFGFESYLVDFKDKEQARELLRVSGALGSAGGNSSVFVSPYGSGILVVDELKTLFVTVLMWMFGIVGGIAVIILASIIGRTVSEGRRESSIFRAIGASRLDVGSIYGTYVLLLALRVMIFAAVLGIGIALVVEIAFWQDATLGAKLAYASADINKEFHLFSLFSPYLLWIAGAILVASVLASIVPILLGARRNPIKDMRNDT